MIKRGGVLHGTASILYVCSLQVFDLGKMQACQGHMHLCLLDKAGMDAVKRCV